MDFTFDFNGDSLGPEQDHLFDDLLDDLAFESELNNFDANNFLDFDFGAGVLELQHPIGVTEAGSSSTPYNQVNASRSVSNTFSENSWEEEISTSKNTTDHNSHKRKTTAEHPTKPSKKPDSSPHDTLSTSYPVPVVSASSLSAARIQALVQLPVSLLKAFNGGDTQKVREMIRENALKNCALLTPALDTELFGQDYVATFFDSVYESHPDAVWVAKKSKFVPERNEVTARIYFAGTRIMQSSKGSDLSGSYAEHLFKKKNASLLDEMDVSSLSEAEICAMKELENLGCNLSLFAKGSMTLLIDEETGKITKFSVMWVITSFRQASI